MYFWHQDIVGNNLTGSYDLVFQSFGDSLKRSLSSLFPFFELQNDGLEDYGLRIILLPIMATVFIGLRRKLERRFRH